jgi:hypothetical protein
MDKIEVDGVSILKRWLEGPFVEPEPRSVPVPVPVPDESDIEDYLDTFNPDIDNTWVAQPFEIQPWRPLQDYPIVNFQVTPQYTFQLYDTGTA